MGRFTLEELECDEIHAALVERRADLNKRKTKLIEDGLPEAADGIDKRLRLYDQHDGPDGKARAGLVRMFAPQRDIESEAEQARRGEGRNPDGQQDIFGGGAETGGASRGSAKVDSSAPGDNAGEEIVDVDYEIIPEGRRLSASSTLTIESALKILEQVARILLAGPAHLDDADFDNFANAVVAVVPAMNPAVDPEYVRAHVLEELRAADDNAHGLAHYVQRNVEAIRDLRDNPPAPKSDAEPPQFIELTAEERDGLTDEDRAEYDAELAEYRDAMAKHVADVEAQKPAPGDSPISDTAADALRAVVFPDAETDRDIVGDLSFETPADRGETEAGESGTNDGSGETKAANGETNDAAAAVEKGAKKKRGRKPKK